MNNSILEKSTLEPVSLTGWHLCRDGLYRHFHFVNGSLRDDPSERAITVEEVLHKESPEGILEGFE
jgi:hypothetical protein